MKLKSKEENSYMNSMSPSVDSKALFSASMDIPINKAIGITSTVPIEIVFAAGYVPVDLNNIFICDEDPYGMVESAETMGFPRNTCSWIKGIYTATKNIGTRKVIGVVQGDCSHTNALLEVFQSEGIEVIPFSYPHRGDRRLLEQQLLRLAEALGVELYKAQEMKVRLDKIRRIIHEIDRLTWEEGKVSGEENHYWNVSTSDMMGDYESYERKATEFVNNAINRVPQEADIRIGFLGVPPICTDLYTFLERLGAHVIFNEVQRQFSMPYPTESLIEQYARYTYPYSIFSRLDDIKGEIKRRDICGVIHYVQSFCFRNIQDKIFRPVLSEANVANIGVPMLTLECDRPGNLDGAMKTRIEAFIEMLKGSLY